MGVVTGSAAYQGPCGRTDQHVAPGVVTATQGADQTAQQAAGDRARGDRALHLGVGAAQLADRLVAVRVVVGLGGGGHLGTGTTAEAGAAAEQHQGKGRS
ncbi:hypothetical protein D3C84_812690 [compost metagenome]